MDRGAVAQDDDYQDAEEHLDAVAAGLNAAADQGVVVGQGEAADLDVAAGRDVVDQDAEERQSEAVVVPAEMIFYV